MSHKPHFSLEDARQIGESLGVTWEHFDVEQFRMGLNVELEHGRCDPHTDVTHDNSVLTGKIALAHLNEFPDYYTRLDKMEAEAKVYWQKEGRSWRGGRKESGTGLSGIPRTRCSLCSTSPKNWMGR